MPTPMTVYAYGNVDALHGVFNAVAMVMNGEDFADMVRIAVYIGFLVVATFAVVPQNLKKGLSWFLSVTLLTGILLTPKATVTIVDRLAQDPPAVVDNVPWALAALAQVKTSIGATLTDLFETAFQTIPSSDRELPAELAYQQNGVMFGNRLVRASREADFSGLNYQGEVLSYMRNCVFPSLGREANPGTFERSTDLLDYVSDPNPALFTSYYDYNNGGTLITVPCPQAYPRIVAGVTNSADVSLQLMSGRMHPGMDPTSAREQTEAGLLAMYGKSMLADAGSSAQDIMIQNIMINATADAAALYGASLNDPAVMLFASMRSQTVAQMNAGYLVQGRVAEEALPIIRNVTDAILYAVFPVICILLIASEGQALAKAFKGYVFTLLWVELWPPMFAVVSYLQTLRSAANLEAAGTMPVSTGLTLQTATGVYSTAISDVAISAWMVTFVPVIAGAVLFGMDRIMSIAGARGGSLEAQGAAGQATMGNTSMGNLSFGQQQLAEHRSDPAMFTTQGVGGKMMLDRVTGAARYQNESSSGPVTINDVRSMARERGASASANVQLAESEAKAADASVRSAYAKVDSLARSGALTGRAGEAWRAGVAADEAETAADARKAAETLATKYGTTDVLALQRSVEAGAQVPVIASMLGLRAGTTGSAADRSDASKDVTETLQALTERRSERAARRVENFANESTFEAARQSNRQATDEVRADLQRASSFRTSADARLSEAKSYQEDERLLSALQRSWNFNNANALYEHFARRGLNPNNPNITDAQWRDATLSFLRSGQINSDDQGLPTFMPEIGQGPVFILDHSNLTPGSLRAEYTQADPMGGEGRVLADGVDRTGLVGAAQQRAGVTPEQPVGGGGLKLRVDQGLREVEGTIAAGGRAANDSMADRQAASDDAFAGAPGTAGNEYGAHPFGLLEPDARQLDITRPRPGAAEKAQRDEKLVRDRAEIPTRPPSGGTR